MSAATTVAAIAGIVGATTAVAGTAYSMAQGTPKAPAIAAPPVIPTAMSSAVTQAKQNQIAAAQSGSGRQSTMLTQNGTSDTLG